MPRILLLLLATTAQAQTPAQPETARLQAVLSRAATADAALRSTLPSFACKEDVLSEEVEGGKKPKVRRRVNFTANLRVERRADGEFHETFEPASWAAILTQSGGIGIPFYLSGGFQRALDYFDPVRFVCYRFALNGNRLDFNEAPDALQHPACKDETGLNGFALLDASGDIVHVQRTIPDEVSRRTNLAPFVAIDLAPTILNGQVYRLSTRVVSDGHPGKTYGHFEANYSGCSLFHATVTIKPNVHTVPDDKPTPPR